MRSSALLSFVLCLFVAPAAGAGAPPAEKPPSKTEATKARLDRGEVIITPSKVPGSEYPRITAMGVVDVPPPRIWKLLDDPKGYKTALPRVLDSKEIKRTPKKVIYWEKIKVPMLPDFVATFEATTQVVPGKRWVRDFRMIKGDYKKNVGRWTLVPFGRPDRTMILYEVHVEPKFHVPKPIQKDAMRRNVPLLFTHLRKYFAEQDAKKKAGEGGPK